ncbi:MAG: isoprenylcysteine carboxylmethyltransferase family protein [Terracidiphilus sp.]|jgi:protein-S-isoprenylcysteine O-methyltransferase Ste14
MPDSRASLTDTKLGLSLLGRIRKLAGGMSMMFLWVAIVFCGAGRLDWTRGWICTAVYVLTMTLTGALAHRLNPGLLEARTKFIRKDSPTFDKIFVWIYFPLTFIQVLVAGLDAVRFRTLPLPQWTLVPGIALFLAAMAMVNWTFLINPFAETTVRIQQDRGHKVVSTGPYRIVRHPMYLGSILMYPATAMMLGSGWAMAVAALILVLIVWRTAKEDRFLHCELPGYREYAAHTRYRLIPGLW